jgi:hypothetical protein
VQTLILHMINNRGVDNLKAIVNASNIQILIDNDEEFAFLKHNHVFYYPIPPLSIASLPKGSFAVIGPRNKTLVKRVLTDIILDENL